MFRMLRIATCASLLTLTVGFAATASAAELNVVASFSIIADFAKNVGGDRVNITSLVGPDGDAHVYEPRPAGATAVEQADVVLENGLQFEGFMLRLVETSRMKAPIIEATKGIDALKAAEEEPHHEGAEHAEAGHDHHDHGHEGHHHHHCEFDPHAWQSVGDAVIYVKNIADAFCAANKTGCDTYTANAVTYTSKLNEHETAIKAAIDELPSEKRTVITSHDAFGYFERDYGIKFIAPEGISTEAEASAAGAAKLIDQLTEDKASAIFLENITNSRLIEQIDSETGRKVGGTRYSDALCREDGPAPTYINMFRRNVATIETAIVES